MARRDIRGKLQPEYHSWVNMRNRCNNPKTPKYTDYGRRGIRVCARWDSFEVFLSDMGPRPAENYSLDRINNNGNYEPGNCRWATATTQARNKRSTLLSLSKAREIRKRVATGESQASVARGLLVSKGLVYRVVHNLLWRE